MTRMSGAEYLARTLDAYGVSSVFLVPTVLSRTLYELEQRTDVQRIVTHGEKAAAYMADGYARATGRPGVCMAQNIGAANLAAGLRDSYLGCSPVIALTGGPYEYGRGRNYYQEIEDFPLFKPVTRWSSQVHEAQRLPDMLAQAFRAATAGKPGPAHLELGGHTGDLIENADLDAEIPTDALQRLPAHRSAPDADAIAAAARLLAGAERPVVVAGGGVRASGAGEALVAVAERLGAAIATSLNGKDTVPGDHPMAIGVPGLYARASANQIILEADVVLYVGSQTGSQLTLTWQVPPPNTTVVQIDIDPRELGRHYPSTVGLLGDARTSLELLLESLGGLDPTPRHAWGERVQELGRRWRAEVAPLLESEQVPMRPERIIAEMQQSLPADAVVLSDTGHAGMWTGGYLDLSSGQSFLRAAGSLGWGLPAAIGAQIALPDRPVVLFTGDGGLWYHVAELETAARWGVPLVVVVNNNRSLNQEIGPYTTAYGGKLHGRHHELWHFQDVDLAAMAQTMGVHGIRVDKPGDMAAAMDEALSTPGPVLLDVTSDIDVLAPKGKADRAPQ